MSIRRGYEWETSDGVRGNEEQVEVGILKMLEIAGKVS